MIMMMMNTYVVIHRPLIRGVGIVYYIHYLQGVGDG